MSRFSPYEWQSDESDEEDETVPSSGSRRAPPTSSSEDPQSLGISAILLSNKPTTVLQYFSQQKCV